MTSHCCEMNIAFALQEHINGGTVCDCDTCALLLNDTAMVQTLVQQTYCRTCCYCCHATADANDCFQCDCQRCMAHHQCRCVENCRQSIPEGCMYFCTVYARDTEYVLCECANCYRCHDEMVWEEQEELDQLSLQHDYEAAEAEYSMIMFYG